MSRPGWNGHTTAKAVAYVVHRENGICILCGHPGANSLDHVQPFSTHPELEWDPSNWRAIHLDTAGLPKGCQTPDCPCPGNKGRGRAPLRTVVAITRGLTCTCDCTCGARGLDLDELLQPLEPTGHWLRDRHLWPRTTSQQRIAEDNVRYSDEEATRAAAAYRQGDRSEWAVTGYNVYSRRRPSYVKDLVNPPTREW